LPPLDPIEHARAAVEDLIDVMGQATIEAVPLRSAARVVGPEQQGKRTDPRVVHHGSQPGRAGP
jgi:hypothetical protein